MSFNVNSKLAFSFQLLSFSWDSLVKNFDKDNFKYLSQEFDSEVLDHQAKKILFLWVYKWFSKNLKEQFPIKEKLYSLLTGKKC